MSTVRGLLLAAGEGKRLGVPKSLLLDEHGVSLLARAVRCLLDGGCDGVTVVLGAATEAVDHLAAEPESDLAVAVAEDWAEGMGASLRTGLTHPSVHPSAAGPEQPPLDAVVVSLVDLPDVGAAVVRRLLEVTTPGSATLARAAYDGRPGHPVVIGREHWAGVVATARGDRGARDYLRQHEVTLVECGDLATGSDVDTAAHAERHGLGLPPG